MSTLFVYRPSIIGDQIVFSHCFSAARGQVERSSIGSLFGLYAMAISHDLDDTGGNTGPYDDDGDPD